MSANEDLLKEILTRDNDIQFNQHSVGAGFVGTIILVLSFCIALALNEVKFFGWMMTSVAVGLLAFNIDTDILNLTKACGRIVFRNRHVSDLANELIECNQILDEVEKEFIGNTDKQVDTNAPIFRKNKMAEFIKEKKEMDSKTIINTFENRLYNDTDETYATCINVLEAVGNLMPLAGLIGTVYGIKITLDGIGNSTQIATITSNIAVAMQTTLWGAGYSIMFKVLASRFKQKREALDYDFERLKNHIELIHKGS